MPVRVGARVRLRVCVCVCVRVLVCLLLHTRPLVIVSACMCVCVCCASFNPRGVPGHAAIVDPGVPPGTSEKWALGGRMATRLPDKASSDRSWMEALHH